MASCVLYRHSNWQSVHVLAVYWQVIFFIGESHFAPKNPDLRIPGIGTRIESYSSVAPLPRTIGALKFSKL